MIQAFDWFFTSVKHLKDIQFLALATAIEGRKNIPVLNDELKREESRFLYNVTGVNCMNWQDTKSLP